MLNSTRKYLKLATRLNVLRVTSVQGFHTDLTLNTLLPTDYDKRWSDDRKLAVPRSTLRGISRDFTDDSSASNQALSTPEDVLRFWFQETNRSQWWVKDPEFDNLILHKFGALHSMAAAGQLSEWRKSAKGSLAEIIILDQFTRNLYRDTPAAFACDALALQLTEQALANGFDVELEDEPEMLSFLYMPFMHSECPTSHEIALVLFSRPGLESNYNFELQHKAIINRFGRYPHRNDILGRQSTEEEIAFLKEDGSSF